MGPAEALGILAAGFAAGTVNAIVGSGSLITFPTLLAFGFPPVLANVSNNIGLVPGNATGALGYRRELAGQRRRLTRLGVVSAAGSAAGAAALLTLPSASFEFIVPVLILAACALVLAQPWLSRRLAARRGRAAAREPGTPDSAERLSPVLAAGILASAAYGGYFGAAQGVLVIGLLGTFFDDGLQRANGGKNVLIGIVNGVAAVIYIALAHVDWLIVVLIAAGSSLGGVAGARFGRRLPPIALRVFVVVIGVVSAVRLVFF